MKGSLAHRSVGIKLLTLLLLAITGFIVFSSLALLLIKSLYGIGSTELYDVLTAGGNSVSSGAVRLMQGLNTVGIFLFPALMGAYLFSNDPEKFLKIDRWPQPFAISLILLAAIAYGIGPATDLIYRWVESWQLAERLPWLKSLYSDNEELLIRQYELMLQMGSPAEFVQVLLTMAVLPAVAEEALFRGVVQPLIRKSAGIHLAVWITATLFALLHQQLNALLPILFLGAVLGYLRAWSRSLWVPTVLHLLNNGLIVVGVYFFDLSYRDILESAGAEEMGEAGTYWPVLLLLAGLVGFWLWSRNKKTA